MSKQLSKISQRGLTLPEPTRQRIRSAGIFCRAALAVVFQENTRRWAIRAEETGGAVAELGHYVGFTNTEGRPISWSQRIQNFMPNGMHAVAFEPAICRVEMFRYENTYDLLISRHRLVAEGQKRPLLISEIVFFSRSGALSTELWGKDSAFRGGVPPRFFKKNGEERFLPAAFLDAALKVTEGACCVGCRHCHLLEQGVSATNEALA